jgi:hypothetical protein
MEKIKNKLPDDIIYFFKDLSSYIDERLYFYGSIQRYDYFHGYSDIDVDIFTDNEHSMINKLQHFLHIPKKEFKKVFWRLNDTNQLVYGDKVMYRSSILGVQVELSIYNKKYKEDIIKDHCKKIVLPFYASIILVILKFIYYRLNLINRKTYAYYKKKILSYGIGLPDDDFIAIDSHITLTN